MKIRRRLITLAATAALVIGGGTALVATAGPAHAQTSELCLGSGGYSDECLNAWFGGPPVYDWHGGVTNENYDWVLLPRCDSAGTSTANCPMAGNPVGKDVVEIYDVNDGQCVGDENNDPNNYFAGEVTCPNLNGQGGGWGTVFLILGSQYGCLGGSLHFYNAHRSNGAWVDPAGLKWPTGAFGSPISLNNVNPYCIYEDDTA
jgi:hypothetical protein